VMFGANRNWIFFGLHALAGFAGLTLIALSAGRGAPPPGTELPPPSE
jgi:hypothetical protein